MTNIVTPAPGHEMGNPQSWITFSHLFNFLGLFFYSSIIPSLSHDLF